MPFTDRMKTDLPQGAFLSTTILNLDEAMWGTSGLVVSELKSNKKEFPNAVLVADADGVGRKQWQLEEENSAVIVTDPQGVVHTVQANATTGAFSLELAQAPSPLQGTYRVTATVDARVAAALEAGARADRVL